MKLRGEWTKIEEKSSSSQEEDGYETYFEKRMNTHDIKHKKEQEAL